MDGARVKVVDEHGSELSGGFVGELSVRGPELCLGYLGNDGGDGDAEHEGWFATGDLGSVDGDGYLTIAGRRKDVIVRGGENVSAKEVEDLLSSHPAVGEVAVVAMADDVMGSGRVPSSFQPPEMCRASTSSWRFSARRGSPPTSCRSVSRPSTSSRRRRAAR